MTRRLNIVFVIAMLAVAGLACNLTDGGQDAPAAVPEADAPVVEIRVPVNGMSFAEGTGVIIQVVGTDSGSGVSRIDLQVDDLPAGSSPAPNASGQSAYIANFTWTAQGIGAHSISAQAFRSDGTASAPAIISITVIEAPPTDIPEPTATPTTVPEQPTEEPTEEPEPTEAEPEPTDTPTGPRATTSAGVNVRSGPSTFYQVIGGLIAGTELELTGRNADSSWFRTPYGLSEGWVYGPLLTLAGDTASLPVINVPPPPPTPVPPTAVPPTSIPPTAPPAGPSIEFSSTSVDGTSYSPGTCISFFWNVSGIREVYFDNQPTVGQSSAERCPTSTTSYTLRVVLLDGGVTERTITVSIN